MLIELIKSGQTRSDSADRCKQQATGYSNGNSNSNYNNQNIQFMNNQSCDYCGQNRGVAADCYKRLSVGKRERVERETQEACDPVYVRRGSWRTMLPHQLGNHGRKSYNLYFTHLRSCR